MATAMTHWAFTGAADGLAPRPARPRAGLAESLPGRTRHPASRRTRRFRPRPGAALQARCDEPRLEEWLQSRVPAVELVGVVRHRWIIGSGAPGRNGKAAAPARQTRSAPKRLARLRRQPAAGHCAVGGEALRRRAW